MPGFFRPVSPSGGPKFSVERHLARMRTLAHRMLLRYPHLRRFENTSDLVQNAVIRLDRAMSSPGMETPRSVIALAVTQLNRELADMIRRNRMRERWAACAVSELDAESTEDRSLEDWRRFHEAVESLPQEQRDAVQFLWYLGLDQETAAASLGVSPRTLRRRWREGRESLRKGLPDFTLS